MWKPILDLLFVLLLQDTTTGLVDINLIYDNIIVNFESSIAVVDNIRNGPPSSISLTLLNNAISYENTCWVGFSLGIQYYIHADISFFSISTHLILPFLFLRFPSAPI